MTGAPLCFGVVCSPVERIHPAACGTFRALRERDPVGDGWDLPRAIRARVRKTTRIRAIFTRDYRVFDCEPITVVSVPSLDGWEFLLALSVVLHDVEVFAFHTWVENTVREDHAFAVFEGGGWRRFVRACKGWELQGWHWETEGDPQAIEDVSAYGARWPSQRMNRARVLSMAGKLGVDAEAVLAEPSKGLWINARAL